MTEITERLSAALADRYKIKRHLGEGGMATVDASVNALVLLTLAAGCVFPTDRSVNVSVELVTPAVLLVAGDTLNLEARVVDAEGTPVPRAELFFFSDDPTVVIADQSGKLRAVGRGETHIIASASGFEGARPEAQRSSEGRGKAEDGWMIRRVR